MVDRFKKLVRKDSYIVKGEVSEQDILNMAMRIAKRRFKKGRALTSPVAVKSYLSVKLASLEHEVFKVIFLDNRHRVLAFDEMFRGSINSAQIYVREVVKEALGYNAAAIILVHNHPSGVAEPSQSDVVLTKEIKKAMKLIDVRVLDHLIVGGDDVISLAERGDI